MEHNTQGGLTPKEEYDMKKKKKQEGGESELPANTSTKKIVTWIIAIVLLGLLTWAIVTSPKVSEEDILARNGAHWHIDLEIFIDGVPVEVSANIGLTGGHSAQARNMHTHDTDGVIHAEKAGFVTNDDFRLKEFFNIWNRDFSADSILGNKVNEEKTISFFVDGEPNQEFEEYILRDGAQIEIRYE